MFTANIYSDGEYPIAIPTLFNPIKKRFKHNRFVKVQLNSIYDDKDNFDNVSLNALFDMYYNDVINLSDKEIENYIVNKMFFYFKDEEQAEFFVKGRIKAKFKSIIERKHRFKRKANLNKFNYFCTFTYDSSKCDEENFIRKIKKCFQNLHTRKGWNYMYVFERGNKTERLHIHGLFYIPEGKMVGRFFEMTDFNEKTFTRKKTIQNTFFYNRFGRCDFEELDCNIVNFRESVSYILKYITKSNSKIVYSRGIPATIKVSVEEKDIICQMINKPFMKFIMSKDSVFIDRDGCYGKLSDVFNFDLSA